MKSKLHTILLILSGTISVAMLILIISLFWLPAKTVLAFIALCFAQQVVLFMWMKRVQKNKEIPSGFRVYECTDCRSSNVKYDNGEMRVGFCDKCNHPLWN